VSDRLGGEASYPPRVLQLIDDLEAHEGKMRNLLLQIVEFTQPDDDLYGECRRLLKALDG